jgi:hypothetical protein
MSQPWDIPSTPATGDTHEDAISLAVGRALTSWEFVEEELAQIFAILVNADMSDLERAPAVRAYGSIMTARGRAEMLEAAGIAYFYNNPKDQVESEFSSVLQHYRGFSARRNDIAHGRVGQDSQNPAQGWYLYPGLYNSKKYPIGGQPPKYLYSSNEINRFNEGFQKLCYDVVDLATKL